jgi:hypothetical protein
MTLNALAKHINIKRSIEKYFYDNLSVSEGLSIDWEGVKFDNKTVSEWLQPRIIDTLPLYVGHASTTEYGEQTNILFQVNIFVKKSTITVSDRHYKLRDVIVGYFTTGQEIPIADHDSDDQTVITYMKVRRIADDRPLPEDQNTYQYVISFEIDFTKATTR